MGVIGLWWVTALVYKFKYFKMNSNLMMKTVEVGKQILFKKFCTHYLEILGWFLGPTAIFMKFFSNLNIYDFFTASFCFLGFLFVLSLNKVIQIVFKIYLAFKIIDNLINEMCYNWQRSTKINFNNDPSPCALNRIGVFL